MKRIIRIFPNDTLFFRSGRPFTMGSETWSDVIFPPYPSTIYGAIRTFLLFQRGGNLSNFDYSDIGTPNKKGSLELYGPILYEKGKERDTLFFPIPLDLVIKKDSKNNKSFILSKIKKPDFFFCDYKLKDLLFYKEEEQIDNLDGYIDDITLKNYLECKEKQDFCYVEKKHFYTFETKTGIARDRIALTSKEGYLYRIPMIRLRNNIGILIKLSGIDENMPNREILQLGGEGKTAYYEELDKNLLESLENVQLNYDSKGDEIVFKLYLATPAIFKKGWIPCWINEETMVGVYKDIKLKLISCAVGKYLRIGGWDIAKNKPKPTYKAVPAGSVYYFKVLSKDKDRDNIIQRIKYSFHLKNISDINPEEGFGLALVGGVS